MQNLQDSLGKVTTERDSLKKELEAKTMDIQEKLKTITQVKKIGRRYKTQYEELKEQHDKVHHNILLFSFFHLNQFNQWKGPELIWVGHISLTDGGRGCF